MKKLASILFALMSLKSISQERKAAIFTEKEIDSIAVKNGMSLIAEGPIEGRDEKGNIAGNGGFSVRLFHFNTDQATIDTLTRQQQRHYDFKKNAQLVKGVYHSVFYYTDNDSQDVTAEFYYSNAILKSVKITETTMINKIRNQKIQHIDPGVLNESIANDFSFCQNLTQWISDQNAQILKYNLN